MHVLLLGLLVGWDAAGSGGPPTGGTQTKTDVAVSNGLFTVPELDFGSAAFSLAPATATGPGDLDTSFGSGGIVTTPIGPERDRAIGVALQPDGKIVAAGDSESSNDSDFALVRYTMSGEPDATFGSGGIVTTPIGPANDSAYGIALQPDGKIVAVGFADNGSDVDFALVRYTDSGNLDTTFGNGGIVTTPIGPGFDTASSVALQSDGKIVAVGAAHSGSDFDFAVVRYTVSGDLDTSFGTSGVVTTPIGPDIDWAKNVALQPDGKIVVAGGAESSNDRDFAVVRYTVSGTLDTTFGSGGVVTTPIGPGGDQANDIALQPDGRIVAAGYADSGGNGFDFAVVRYTVSGNLDTTFGSGGVVTTSIGSVQNDYAEGVALQPDGKILVAGSAEGGGSSRDFVVVRYTISGDLDTTFGTGGVVTTPIGPGEDRALDVAIQLDGRIVAAGYAHNDSDEDLALVRYHGRYSVYLPLGVKSY